LHDVHTCFGFPPAAAVELAAPTPLTALEAAVDFGAAYAREGCGLQKK